MIIKVAIPLLCGITSLAASEGLYVGLGMGRSFLHGEPKNKFSLKDRTIRKSGNLTSAYIGYNHAVKDTPLFVGIELGALTHAMKKTIQNASAALKLYEFTASANNSLHGHLKLGVTVNNVSFYCKGGGAQTNFKTSLSFDGQNQSRNFTKYGECVGIGAEAKMNENFSIGIEYVKASYGKLGPLQADINGKVLRLDIKPEIHLTSLRLIYNF